jgi:hypothetical protein
MIISSMHTDWNALSAGTFTAQMAATLLSGNVRNARVVSRGYDTGSKEAGREATIAVPLGWRTVQYMCQEARQKIPPNPA